MKYQCTCLWWSSFLCIHILFDSISFTVNKRKKKQFVHNEFCHNLCTFKWQIHSFNKNTRITKWRLHTALLIRFVYLASALAAFLACTSLLIRIVSRFTGLGIKPTSPPSFTGRPIHQSLLNFCKQQQQKQHNILKTIFIDYIDIKEIVHPKFCH